MKTSLKKVIPPFALDFIKKVLSCFGQKTQKIPKSAMIFSDNCFQIFFGYYDIAPFSDDSRYLLASRAPAENLSPHKNHPDLELGYYDLNQDKPDFTAFSKSKTWNWQQGCRLQWFRDNVIYNTVTHDRYLAVIQNPFSEEVIQTFDKPIYAVNTEANFALTLDFDRLHQCRLGYGYNHFPNSEREDIIWRIDLESGQITEILAMQKVKDFMPLPSMKSANHYFNHLSISPQGTRFMVTHLWISEEGKRYSRMVICDLKNGHKLFCPNNSGHTSHYCWHGDHKIILFGTQKSNGQRYYVHDLVHDETSVLGASELLEDGHPTYLGNGTMITDTYPNYLRQQNLLRYDINNKKLEKLAAFHTPVDYVGEVRCDLHPRVNKSGDRICVDIVHGGRRAMCVLYNSKG